MMYSITEQKFGFRITFSKVIEEREIVEWYRESEERLSSGIVKPFCVMVDMRSVKTVSPVIKSFIIKGQKLYHEKGMCRSVVIADDPMMMKQLKLAAKTSGIYKEERYIDVRRKANWVNVALLWIREGVFNEAGYSEL